MQWDWQIFFQDNGGGVTYGEWLLSAWGWTFAVFAAALVLSLVLGVLVGVARTVPSTWGRGFGEAWTELFRNVPLLVQVFMWYQVLPSLFPWMQKISSFVLIVVALGLFTSARIAEQVKAGILTLAKGQNAAALALGLTRWQSYRYVILPVSLRIVLPPLTSEAMSLVKNSSVAFAVSVVELTMFAMQAQEETARGVEIYLVVTGLYFLTSLAVNRVFVFIENKTRVPGVAGAKL